MEKLRRDLRTALTASLRNPGVSAITILTLALGIGANTAIFSLLNAIVLRPLPVPQAGQLVSLATTIPDSVNGEEPFSLQMFQALQRSQGTLSDVFAWNGRGMNNFEAAGRHLTAVLATASGNYYHAMGIAPRLGRFLTPSDVPLTNGVSPAVAVISYRAWRDWYDSNPVIIGNTLRIEDRPFTIVGVEPESFPGLVIDRAADVVVPLFAPGTISDRDARLLWLHLYGRMKPEVTLEQARANLQALWPSIQDATRPPGFEGQRRARFYARRLRLDSAANGVSTLRKGFAQPLQVLLALVGAVLLIACLNLTNLSLAKAASRQHIAAVRSALGASAWDLVSPALLESLLMSFAGAGIGLLLAHWCSRELLKMAWTDPIQTPLTPTLDYRVIAFTAAVAIAAGLIPALVPSWQAAKINAIAALRQNTRSVHGDSSAAGRLMLVVQIALSLLLVLGALSFGSTLVHFYSVDPGFRKDHLLTVTLFSQAGNRKAEDTASYYRLLAAKVHDLPGIANVSYSSDIPAGGFEWRRQVARLPKSDATQAIQEVVSPGFFATVGMPILSGRDFSWEDDLKKPPVVIISRSLAEHLFGQENPVGRDIYWGPVPYQDRVRVIGVVNSASLWKVESVRPMAVYSGLAQNQEFSDFTMTIRTWQDARGIKTAVEKTISSLGRQYALQEMTIDERLNTYTTAQRLTAMLASFFGVLALLIAAIGLYGLLSFQVTKRRTELGTRLALGAERWQIISIVLRQVLVTAALGCLLGLAGSLMMRSLVGSLLYGVSTTDPILLACAASTLMLISLVAGFIPAMRAAAVDPVTALRAE